MATVEITVRHALLVVMVAEQMQEARVLANAEGHTMFPVSEILVTQEGSADQVTGKKSKFTRSQQHGHHTSASLWKQGV